MTYADPRYGRRRWSTEEDARLAALLATGVTLEAAANALGRSYRAVQSRIDADPRLQEERLTRVRAWTEAEDAALRAGRAQGRDFADIALELGRTSRALRERLHRLNKGAASTRRALGRPAPSWADLVARHARARPAAPGVAEAPCATAAPADDAPTYHALSRAERKAAPRNLDLWHKWERWNAALGARLRREGKEGTL